MPSHLFATPFDHALARLGCLEQVARIDQLAYTDGPMRGSRLLRATTGGGLSFEVHPDRALDIGALDIAGRNCAWLSPTRLAHPGLYDGSAPTFLRTFGGGLLATCGLDHTGPRHEVDGEVLPQHGRIGATPASLRRAEVSADALVIEGTVRQVAAMQEHLTLERRIEAPLGGTSLRIVDRVTNRSTRPQPHVVLYHCNFGWPLLSEHAELHVDSTAVEPQTSDAAASPFAQLDPPTPNRRECVYLHTMQAGRVTATLTNPHSHLRMRMQFDSAVLPGLVEWKMLAERVYALGLEPTNVRSLGPRERLRERGHLPELAPDESVTYALELDFSYG